MKKLIKFIYSEKQLFILILTLAVFSFWAFLIFDFNPKQKYTLESDMDDAVDVGASANSYTENVDPDLTADYLLGINDWDGVWSVNRFDLANLQALFQQAPSTIGSGTPNTGAFTTITGNSIIVTGLVDGLVNISNETDGAETVLGTGKMAQIVVNGNNTEATAFNVTLPAVPIPGMQLLVKNGYGDNADTTGVITIIVGADDYIWNPTTKARCPISDELTSGGAAGDMVGIAALTANMWETFGSVGTWTCTAD